MKHLISILLYLFILLALAACASQPANTPTPVPTSLPATPTSRPPAATLPAIPSVTVAEAQQPGSEEIKFQSGVFNIVGDLRLPEGIGPFPVVLFVHGSGMADRMWKKFPSDHPAVYQTPGFDEKNNVELPQQ